VTQLERLLARIDKIPEVGRIQLPSEWPVDNRRLTSGVSQRYGDWDWSLTPHWIEPRDCLHPDSPVTFVAIMKSVQAAFTTAVMENGIGWVLANRLGSALMMTASLDLAKIRSSANIDTMIDNSDLRDMVNPHSTRMARKSADSGLYKEFSAGGRFQVGSYGSISASKSNSFNIVNGDEIEEAVLDMKDQGDVFGLMAGRTMGQVFHKELYGSTPGRMETSPTWRAFCWGDQRRLFLPCPICGRPQLLTRMSKKMGILHGLTFSMKDDENGQRVLDPTSVRYKCEHCTGEFYEAQKKDMLQKGEWVPTWKDTEYKPKSANHRSYHAPGLVSPFLSWERYVESFVGTKFGEDVLAFKDFTINFDGWPWAKVEHTMDWKAFKKQAEDYVLGTCPDGVLRVFAGVDVQGDRLECGIVGVGRGLEAWLLDVRVFHGKPEDINDASWENLRSFLYTTSYRNNRLGADLLIARAGIDTGYDPRQGKRAKDWTSKAHTVHQFVSKNSDKCVAVRGSTTEWKGVKKAEDIVRVAAVSGGVISKRYDIGTSIFKELIFNQIEDGNTGPGSIHFPQHDHTDGVIRPLADEIYQQFMSERFQEVRVGVMGWKKIRNRNEVLDLVIYAKACAFIEGVAQWEDPEWDKYEVDIRAILNKK